MSTKLFPGEGAGGFIRCPPQPNIWSLNAGPTLEGKVVGPAALVPSRLASPQEPPLHKSGRWLTAGPTSAPSRWYWASLQLIRRAVPFNPLIHLAASRRPPACSTTAPSPPGSTEPKHTVSIPGITQQTPIFRLPAPTVPCRQNERACVQAAVAEDLREIEDKASKQGSSCQMQCAPACSRKLIVRPQRHGASAHSRRPC